MESSPTRLQIQSPTDTGQQPDLQTGLYVGERKNSNLLTGAPHTQLTSQGWTTSICQFFAVAGGATQTFYFWLPKWIKQLEQCMVGIQPHIGNWDISVDGVLVSAAVVAAVEVEITNNLINNVLSQQGGRHPVLGMHTLAAKNNSGATQTITLQLSLYVISQPARGAPSDT